MDQLYYELIHNLVLELTRTGIEVKNLKMRVESLTSRLEFNERRARALESAVVYRPSERRTPGAAAAAPAAGRRQRRRAGSTPQPPAPSPQPPRSRRRRAVAKDPASAAAGVGDGEAGAAAARSPVSSGRPRAPQPAVRHGG